jgi:Fic family protein
MAYIYQKQDWAKFRWDNEHLLTLLGTVRHLQGKLIGSMEMLGFDMKAETMLETLTLDVVKTTEIEGEIFNPEQVRSSLAQRLGIEISNAVVSNQDIDGIVDLLLDAIQKSHLPLSNDRFFDWHFSLFPTGRRGMHKILVGQYRNDETGPMQVVSGALGRENVHFQAPSSDIVEVEMTQFINWINAEQTIDPVLKAGIAHLWFLTIHPFDDGNGRIARAITDMLLTKADGILQRYYSMSAQILKEKKEYYIILEKSQKGTLDITDWLEWFLNCLLNALKTSNNLLTNVLDRNKFWHQYPENTFNERQRLVLNKLLNDFFGKLTSSKWAKMTKCSRDTALRDIQDLIDKGILKKDEGGGRNTSYTFFS